MIFTTNLPWCRDFAPTPTFQSVPRSASAFIDGLLSPAERKTGWMLAEEAGFERPYRIQSLLGRSTWSADALRDLIRDYVSQTLGDTGGCLWWTRPDS